MLTVFAGVVKGERVFARLDVPDNVEETFGSTVEAVPAVVGG